MAALQQLEHPSQNPGDTAPKPATYSNPGAIFSMYITRVQKFEDEKNVENWKGGADSILVFTGLFSSTVATFIALSYPNLQQDPNLTTQLLLAQISQQLSNTTTGASSTVGPSVQSSYVPPTSVVFINSVWFLSLVLSLTCALMATLLQQWARRYIQIVQRKYAPLNHARIHEFFSRGARRFGISEFVEVLPILLLLSVFLFFAGLVVFAFRSNHTVAYFTVTIVGFCTLWYIAFTLMPLFFYDCPYHTPLTPVIRFSAQMISLSFLSVLHHGAKQLHGCWGTTISQGTVGSLQDRKKSRARFFSENLVSRLESSPPLLSIDMYKDMLVRTLHWLTEDQELEDYVAGIPGLCMSNALATREGDDTQRTFRDIFAALPGPMNFHASLPWSIIELVERASTSQLPESVRQRRTRACLRALYFIPGAIRDLLAPYAAGKHYCLVILPLLNSPESLDIIDELWDTAHEDVMLSVRCAAAVIAAFMITPPHLTLQRFAPDTNFIWKDNVGKRFLSKRLGISACRDGNTVPESYPQTDSTRLQNLVHSLVDINDRLRNTMWWMSDGAHSISRELYDTRHTEAYRRGHGTYDQQGDRGSPAFVPAAQQDLITLTLEILARDPVWHAETSQREGFSNAYVELKEVVRNRIGAHLRVSEERRLGSETRDRIRLHAAHSFEVVNRVLEPVLQILEVSKVPPLSQGDPPPQILGLQVAATDSTDRRQVSEGAASAHKPSPLSTEGVPSFSQYSVSSNLAKPSPANRDPGPSSRAGELV